MISGEKERGEEREGLFIDSRELQQVLTILRERATKAKSARRRRLNQLFMHTEQKRVRRDRRVREKGKKTKMRFFVLTLTRTK